MGKQRTTRTERVIFRVSKNERKEIEEASNAQGRTPSDFIRRALLRAITEPPKQSDP